MRVLFGTGFFMPCPVAHWCHCIAEVAQDRMTGEVCDRLVLDEPEEPVRVSHEFLGGADAVRRGQEVPARPQPRQPLQPPVQDARQFRLPNLREELLVGSLCNQLHGSPPLTRLPSAGLRLNAD